MEARRGANEYNRKLEPDDQEVDSNGERKTRLRESQKSNQR